jgi:cytidylate kinase
LAKTDATGSGGSERKKRYMSVVIEALKKYLSRKEDLDIPPSNAPFITLTRFDGTGSHEVARAIIARLDELHDMGWNHGWELLDQQLCAWLIKEGHVPATYEQLVAEHYGDEGRLRQMVYEMLVGESEHDELCRKVGDVMRFLLKSGRTVVVGSGAAAEAVSLKGPGIRIRIVASENWRVARLVKKEMMAPDAAHKLIHEQDAERAHMLQEHYRRDINDFALYDATFLADRLSPKEMARATVGLLVERVEAHAKRGPLSATQIISLT